jgi:hypothetical protein
MFNKRAILTELQQGKKYREIALSGLIDNILLISKNADCLFKISA